MNTTFEQSETVSANKKSYKSNIGQLIYAVFLAGVTIAFVFLGAGALILKNVITITKNWPVIFTLLGAAFFTAIVFVAVFRTSSITVHSDGIDMRLGRKSVSLPFEYYLIGSYVHRSVSSAIVINSRYIRAVDKNTGLQKEHKCLNIGKKAFSGMMEDIQLLQKAYRKRHSSAGDSERSFETFIFEIPSSGKIIKVTKSMISIDNEEFAVSEISRIKITPPGYITTTKPKLEIICGDKKCSWNIFGMGFGGERIGKYRGLCHALQEAFDNRDDIYVFNI